MIETCRKVFLESIPLIIMILLIPLIANDYILFGIYTIIIFSAFEIKFHKSDLKAFIFGFFIMTISEAFFVSTGVERFERNSFLGIFPVWLPLLWAYGFVSIKRAINILNLTDEDIIKIQNKKI